MDKIKISFNNYDYIIKEKEGVVVCRLGWALKMSPIQPWRLTEVFPFKQNYDGNYYKDVTTAFCSARNGDEFDVEKGKQIARAKAEMKAYESGKNFIKTHIKRIRDMWNDKEFDEFVDRMDAYSKHNEQYINEIGDCAIKRNRKH